MKLPDTLEGWLKVTLILVWIVAFGWPVLHYRGWLRGADNLQAQAQTGFGVPADVHAFAVQTMSDSHAIALDVHRDVEIAGGTENASRQILIRLRDWLPAFLTDLKSGSSEVPKLIAHGTELEQSLTTATDKLGQKDGLIDQLTITAAQLNTLLAHGWKLVDDADGLVASHQVNELLDGLAKTSQNTAAMTGDFHTWEHEKLFPTPYQGHFKTLHRVYVIGRGVVTLAEPTYYGSSVFDNLKH